MNASVIQTHDIRMAERPDIQEDDETFGEPQSPNNSQQADERVQSDKDSQSSSNYSSSSQSSLQDVSYGDSQALLQNPQASLQTKSDVKTLTSVPQQPIADIDSTLKELISNDDKISSISSLFLSDKDQQNTTSFAGASKPDSTCESKRTAAAIREEDLDDIDKISSPGKPRSKPKSINSPTMLSQNIDQTNKLLQQLS